MPFETIDGRVYQQKQEWNDFGGLDKVWLLNVLGPETSLFVDVSDHISSHKCFRQQMLRLRYF